MNWRRTPVGRVKTWGNNVDYISRKRLAAAAQALAALRVESTCTADDIDDTGAAVRSAIEQLPAKERIVILSSFGFDGAEMSLSDIARQYKVTRERIRQLKAKALQSLYWLLKDKMGEERNGTEA